MHKYNGWTMDYKIFLAVTSLFLDGTDPALPQKKHIIVVQYFRFIIIDWTSILNTVLIQIY